jgi:hypothetical protein
MATTRNSSQGILSDDRAGAVEEIPVTNDMVIAILRDEEGHRRLFEGFLREYEAEGLA